MAKTHHFATVNAKFKMKKKRKVKIAGKKGLPPGSLVFLGDQKADEQNISYFRYNNAQVEEKQVSTIEECFQLTEGNDITWINIEGLHKVKTIEKIGKHYNIHPLILEDILNTEQRSKVEVLDKCILIIFKMIMSNGYPGDIDIEQVSMIVGQNYVITFQEKKGDQFDPVRRRLLTEGSKLRGQGADFLFYALIDVVVDGYYETLESMSDYIEKLEDEVFYSVDDEAIMHIQRNKKDVLRLRPCIVPLRDMITKIMDLEGGELIQQNTLKYLSDVSDHVLQLADMLERIREDNLSLKDLYLSAMSLKMNKVMQVLTIIATIFIPLTFIVGVYGMNFSFIPELQWKYGYFMVWGIMASIGLALVLFFKRKGWM